MEATIDRASNATREELPLAGYATLAIGFATGLTALLATLSREHRLPQRWAVGDLVTTGIATSRLARIVTRDRIGTPFRQPFTEYMGSAGAGEVHERPRGQGLRRALGSLLACPYCATPWIATASLGALVLRPRATRFVQAMLVCATVSDFVQQAYAAVRKLDG